MIKIINSIIAIYTNLINYMGISSGVASQRGNGSFATIKTDHDIRNEGIERN